MILAIDSSAGTSVAIVQAGETLIEHNSQNARGHAEAIGTLIEACLSSLQIRPTQLEAVAVGMGPGPFTGLRVGIAAAVSFGVALGVPVLRVSSHAAIALERQSSLGEERMLVTTDAKRRQRYWSAFEFPGPFELPQLVLGPDISSEEQLQVAVSNLGVFTRVDSEWVSAASVGLLSERLQSTGGSFLGSTPLYLRSPEVTIATVPKRVSQ
ncbi:MAG: tRNA (adenosine(37)-N6)-threonylcarbamoyltransferase complex dimerization subunit type 1 TsaB [Microbacteriaceae bacterium]|mgnify:CR=1 FL=1|nr:tRNA (adenosine(37)-N6)-threonylcarbamoyltransferase complex dimerization subunit type 1 TsaB [Cryobacterium sp.]MBX3104314.1 tRNA (adenosine(37)-N6)-threonylcarbamoyltransferase complex dimerization subunit type 1 TsaB [Cryobacterium sp.]MCC6376426.1 tRNA (adenosine(37)-N6)-threonylcarbamoyltransferase complex dimerization subunit type 1 TsaB [Microbacteriaceae bacterium]